MDTSKFTAGEGLRGGTVLSDSSCVIRDASNSESFRLSYNSASLEYASQNHQTVLPVQLEFDVPANGRRAMAPGTVPVEKRFAAVLRNPRHEVNPLQGYPQP